MAADSSSEAEVMETEPTNSNLHLYSMQLKNKENKNRKLSNVPDEVCISTLLKLPIKSVLRFVCVCKSWLSSILDRSFAKQHFDLATAHTVRLMVLAAPSSEVPIGPYIPTCRPVDGSLNDKSIEFMPSTGHLPLNTQYSVAGSCRGVLLLLQAGCDTLHLWNPSNGAYKKLPISPGREKRRDGYHGLYGIGYESCRDDYVVVRGTQRLNGKTQFDTFSVRENSWKKGIIGDYYFRVHLHRNGSHLRGALHWLGGLHAYEVDMIVAFHLTKGSILHLPLPQHLDNAWNCLLWVHGKKLALCVNSAADDCPKPEIWVMMKYNVQSSWTKLFDVPIEKIPTGDFIPLGSVGDVILGTDYRRGLIRLSLEGQLKDYSTPYPHHVCVYTKGYALYTESLATLDMGVSIQHHATNGQKRVEDMVLDALHHPSNRAREEGVPRELIAEHIGIPLDKLMLAINNLEEEGAIYEVIDDHYKSLHWSC